MKRYVHSLLIVAAVIISVLLSGCGGNPRAVELLARADSLMNVRPDSALTVLNEGVAEMDGCSKSLKVRYRLLQAKAQNKAYIPFTSDSLMLDVVDYYDRYGTNNEQIEAHYLLGCVYRDLGESPHAIDCYQKAAAKADIASADCDYRTLCRVYSQLAEIFYQQNLLDDNLRCLDQSIAYAYKAYDTIAAVNSYAQKLGAYEKRHLTDSIIAVSIQTYKRFSQIGYPEVGSRYLALAVNGYTQKKNLDLARHYMNIYEAKSGYFDSLGNIERGREAYYDIKGKYYLACRRLDSAEYFFRKELREGSDFNNQNKASHRLAELFQIEGKPDSVAKYSLYSYEMNDSVYSQMVTTEIGRLQAIYDYSQHERIAHQKEQEAERFKTYLLVVCALSAILILLFANVYIHNRYEKQQLKDRIRLLKGYSVNKTLYDSPIAQRFRQLLKANPYQIPSLSDWKELKMVISQEIPDFHEKLQTDTYQLSDNEYDICMLIKIQTSCSEIARLKQCSRSNVTHIRERIFKQLFSKNGKADELDEYIMSLS